MTTPKHQRPGKKGYHWPGVYKAEGKHLDKDTIWRLRCPAPMCFYQGAYRTEAEANMLQETHPCPWFGGGTTTISWGIMSEQYLAPMWEELDRVVDLIKAPNQPDPEAPGNDREMMFDLQGQARGIAFALSRLMPPFFHTVEEISQEALVRWLKRQVGEDYETPGMGLLRFKAPPGADVMTPAGQYKSPEFDPKAPRKKAVPVNLRHNLTADEVAKIKAAGSMMPADMLASAYGVSEAVIKSIVDGAS